MSRVALLRENEAKWMFGDTVSGPEFWQLDLRSQRAISESGGSYTLDDPLVLSGNEVTIAGDANFSANIEANDGINLNADGLYIKSGAWVSWLAGSHATMYSGSQLTVSNGATVYTDGVQQIRNGGSLTSLSGSTINWNLGSTATLAGDITVTASCNAVIGGALTWGSGNYPKLSSRSLSRACRAQWARDPYGSAAFGDWTTDAVLGHWTCTVSGARRLGISETIESAATLVAVNVFIVGAPGHTDLPLNMPDMAVLKLNYTTGDVTQLGSWTDTSATLAAYESAHPISSGVLAETFGPHEKLLIRIQTESGTYAKAGSQILTPMVTLALAELRPV